LAFYALLSLTPLLLVVVSLAGLFFSPQAAANQIIWQIQYLIGPQVADGVRTVLEGSRNRAQGIIATAIGILTLLFGASGVLVELRDALNTVWETPPLQTTGLKTILEMIQERLVSFALVLSIGLFLLCSLLVNIAIAALGAFSARYLPIPELVLHVLNSVFSFAVITGLFAAIYKVVPDTKISWRDVFMGAAFTSLLFTAGKLLIALYLGKASFASSYGAAASVVVFIVWIYYSGQIFFLGAEFTRIFASRYGSQLNGNAGLVLTSPQRPRDEAKVEAAKGMSHR